MKPFSLEVSMIRVARAFLFFTSFALIALTIQAQTDAQRWQQRARNVSITRDDWGIAHVHGKTDADAVFGMIYAQAEDDFNRVETNYLNSIGRAAESEGESAIWRDLRMKIFIDPADMKAKYESSPAWLKALMDAWADGLNFYLANHTEVMPKVITHFEPWMALTFSEGSIGGDIESINLTQLQAFYERRSESASVSAGSFPLLSLWKRSGAQLSDRVGSFRTWSGSDRLNSDLDDPNIDPGGSNGIAIAPSNTVGKHSLLLINPHTSFYFRSELQMTSDEGLNAYGASTWGQFFIYQGFNERCGWMHTSSAVDAIDRYLETVAKKGDRFYYKYGNEERPVITSVIKVPYKTAKGMAERTFTAYRTQHGPIIAS